MRKIQRAFDIFKLVSRDQKKPEIEETADLLIIKDVVIAREMVQQYEQGKSYKPANELEAAAWTANGMWCTLYVHPVEQLIVDRNDVAGRMTNTRFVKNLIDHGKTERPDQRGIMVDIEMFKKLPAGAKGKPLTADDIKLLKSATIMDVSIGFTYIEDNTPGSYRGDSYDFVQRDILINHLVVACKQGRCPMPMCGLAADVLGVTDKPIETDTEIQIPVPGENPSRVTSKISLLSSKGIDALYCGKDKKIRAYIFQKSNESKTNWCMDTAKAWIKKYHNDSVKETFLALAQDQESDEVRDKIKLLLAELEAIFLRMDELTNIMEPIYSEQSLLSHRQSVVNIELEAYREKLYWEIVTEGDYPPKTPAERAMQHYSITPADWEALNAEKKAELIAGLPAPGTGLESNDSLYKKAWVQVAKKAWDIYGIHAEDWLLTSEGVKNKLFAELVRQGELDMSGTENAWYEKINWKLKENAEGYADLPDAIKDVLKEKKLGPEAPADPPADPPAGDPPTGDPPAADPPAGDPPAGDPPAGDPPAGDPPVDEPITETPEELIEKAEQVIEQTEKTLADPDLSSNEPL